MDPYVPTDPCDASRAAGYGATGGTRLLLSFREDWPVRDSSKAQSKHLLNPSSVSI